MPDDAETPETEDAAAQTVRLYFAAFNEIGILAQLSRALLDARLPDGLIHTHFGVLNHLVRLGDGRTPLKIAQAFQVPKTSMTYTLAGLEKRGLVEMRPNPEDGRSKLVYLTRAGRELRDRAIEATGANLSWVSDVFPPDRIAALLPELAALRQILDENRPAD